MREERSFQELMNKYNREIMRMKQMTRPETKLEDQTEPLCCTPNPPPPPITEGCCPPPPFCPEEQPPEEETGCCPPPADSEEDEELPCVERKFTDFTQTVGQDGPALMQDLVLHEKLEKFVHSKTVERAVHTKGHGAFGYFQVYDSMRYYTMASVFQDPAIKIPVLVRFSHAGSMRGTPETTRDIRGFSTKFYTKEGIFDLLCNHIPVFLIEDGIRFPDVIAALSPSPVNNLRDPNRFWQFVAKTPESVHAITWLYSDLGTIDSYRYMRAYGVNTYVWKNEDGVRRYVKYHWIPLAGQRTLDREEAQRLACENPDIAGQDLYDTIAKGETVEYELQVQLMDPKDESHLPFDPCDDTKIWDEERYPLMPVGRLTLNQNPENFQSQIEEAAFSPGNLMEGIELSRDKMLQARSFIYWDAQRYRLGRSFRKLPVNCSPGWSPERSIVTSGEGVCASGQQIRANITRTDYFTQAGEHYRSLGCTEKEHLADNIASELYAVNRDIQRCVLDYFHKADHQFGMQVEEMMEKYK